MKINRPGSNFVVFLIFVVAVCAVELPTTSSIDKTIREAFACRKNNPALSVSVVKDGKIVFANGYGVQSLEDKKPVTNTTLFGIASLTKGFTSALLSKLTDESREYNLNTRIAEFYGNHNVFDGYLRSKFATIRDLLSHRMGIPMHNFIRFDSKLTRKNLIRRLKELRPRGRFRDSFYYSNLMYGQAARIAEKIGRKKYEDLVQDELFLKIGMTDSDFFTTANKSTIELANGYIDVYGELHQVPFELSKRWSELCGANCILSSGVDMAKWMLFHLSHGTNQNGRRVMSEEALEDTHKPENVLARSSLSKYFTKPNVPETFSQTGYGLGWRTGHYRGYNMLTHTGSSWGYKNMITMFPDMDVGIYTSMTGDDEDFMFRYSIHQYLADKYMGLNPWLNASLICSFPEPWMTSKPKRSKPIIDKQLMPKRKLDDYLGLYENPAYGQLEIFILDEENSTNKLIAEYGYVDLILYPKSRKDDFFFETDGIAAKLINFGTVQFRSQNGFIDKLRIPSFEPKDPPIFKKVDKPSSKPTGPTTKEQLPMDLQLDLQPTGTDIQPFDTNGKVEALPTDVAPETKSNTRNIAMETKPVDVEIVKTSGGSESKQATDILPVIPPANINTKPESIVKSTGQSATTTKEIKSTNTEQLPKQSTNTEIVKTKITETKPESTIDFITREKIVTKKEPNPDVKQKTSETKIESNTVFVKPKAIETGSEPSTGFVKPKAIETGPEPSTAFVNPKAIETGPEPSTGFVKPKVIETGPEPITAFVKPKAIETGPEPSTGFVKPKTIETIPALNGDLIKPKTIETNQEANTGFVKAKTAETQPAQNTDPVKSKTTESNPEPTLDISKPTNTRTEIQKETKNSFVKPKVADAHMMLKK